MIFQCAPDSYRDEKMCGYANGFIVFIYLYSYANKQTFEHI